MKTTRDHQIDYINETMGQHRPGFDIRTELFQLRESALLKNLNDLIADICERIDDDNEEQFLESWRDKCYDHIIEQIDWDKLKQCDQCHKFYEDTEESRFCSQECEEIYEEER